ncbi:hypothetical protein [Natronorubrum thiooxidans]|uniref:Uncharacterized protein n=1 Tax=Natronorubrum thiooxidans TaxID=308853 RepID=A0A1N7GVS2_9EURY|nr:hypothetical protein [Natronorubrum thiooxidans]SIS16685.1 hypothetical protein SAMN05421752_11625 [Natronorubrum thiooxidans]
MLFIVVAVTVVTFSTLGAAVVGVVLLALAGPSTENAGCGCSVCSKTEGCYFCSSTEADRRIDGHDACEDCLFNYL